MNILLVKTSSLGDVIHNLPVLSDIKRHLGATCVDWVVEQPFAGIPALHAGVGAVVPIALRRWRKTLLHRGTWQEASRVFHRLRRTPYDVVLDTQGLVKSALISRCARGAHCGFNRASARESAAALCYDHAYPVEKNLHAIERNRRLAAQVFGYPIDGPADYGIAPPVLELPWRPSGSYAVLLHATSRQDKLWGEDHWKTLGGYFQKKGMAAVLPWGNGEEEARGRRLAAAIPGALTPPALGIAELARLLADAAIVVGVDTGLTHLAAALHTPVVAIYCASDPGLTGVYAAHAVSNLGGAGAPPAATQVIHAVDAALCA
ncbi:MAG TPA: lipopolysaccharide heptosyltransferase I [Betaproteobacteria bacterium]|nr:lipopolysaccharide heptosyltransferase I [Betaproteobacteria bacterium]